MIIMYIGFFSCFWNKWSQSDHKFGWVSIVLKINNATISIINFAAQYAFLLEWKFKFYIDGHFGRQLNSLSDYVVSLFNISCSTNITKKKSYSMCSTQIEKHCKYYNNDILFPLIPMPNIKIWTNFYTQMKHSHPIINPNVPKKK